MTYHQENGGSSLFNQRNYAPNTSQFEHDLSNVEIINQITDMNIILLGIPGAGKTSFAEELHKRNEDINYLSVGEISRNLPADSPERAYIDELFQAEAPIGDPNFFLSLIEAEIDEARSNGRGFILDGIPKKIQEVQPLLDFLNKKNVTIDAIITCELQPLEAFNRIAARDDRTGNEDSMAVFMNRTKTYLNDIDSIKANLSASGAPLFTLDTQNLNQQECVDHLIAAMRQTEAPKKRTHYDLVKLTESLQLEQIGRAAAELAPLFDDTIHAKVPYEILFSSKTSTEEKRSIIKELLVNQDPLLQCTPRLTNRLSDNYINLTLSSIEHLVTSVIEETQALQRPITTVDVLRIVHEQLETKQLIEQLQSELIDGKDFSEVIDEEIALNTDELTHISKKLQQLSKEDDASLDLSPDGIMRLQPILWNQLTSRKILFSPDSNYRRAANGIVGSHHSLLPYSKPNRALAANSMSSYLPFIEAVSSSDYKYTSTFGFIHLIGVDTEGESYGVEYPIMMHDKRLLNLKNERLNRLLGSIDSFYSTHDIWHNIIPVYAGHFILHHPDAPLSFGGRMPAYLEFGNNKRKDKEEYEIGVAMAHAKTQQERFSENAELRNQQISIITGALDEMPVLKEELTTSVSQQEANDIIDFLSARAVANLYNVLPPEDEIYDTIENKLKKLELPNLCVTIQQITDLLVKQKIIPQIYSNDVSDNDACREMLKHIDTEHSERESGSEYIVKALNDFGVIDQFMQGGNSAELSGVNKVRWIAMMAPQRQQLKGHMEKVHGKNGQYKFGDDTLEDARYLVHLQQKALQKDMPHYLYRTRARKENQQLSYNAYSILFDDEQDTRKLERLQFNAMLHSEVTTLHCVAKEVATLLDKLIDSLVTSTYEFDDNGTKDLIDLAKALKQTADTDTLGDALNSIAERYQDLRRSEIRYQQSIGTTYVEASKKILDEQMTIS